MTEEEATLLLKKILNTFTTGRILGFLSEIHCASARKAREKGDEESCRMFGCIASTLDIVGTGIDAKYA